MISSKAVEQVLGHKEFYIRGGVEVFLDATDKPVSDEVQKRIDELRALPQMPTEADVRAECSRRLQLAFGARDSVHLDQLTAQAMQEFVMLVSVSEASRTPENIDRIAVLKAGSEFRTMCGMASSKLRQASPIFQDYAADKHWPVSA